MQKLKNFSLLFLCMVLVLCSSLVFVACGKNENEIKLNEVTHSIFYAPLYVAYNLGYFEDEGLSVTIESATGSDASMTALISGSSDIALIGPEQVIYSQDVKDRPVIFGQLTQKDGSFIVGKAENNNFTLDDLKGKTIIGGRAGGLPAMTLQYVIEQVGGLTIGTNSANEEVNLRTDVSFPMIASEFITSQSEYCTLFEPTATNLEKAGNGYVLKAVGDFSGYLPYTCFVAKSSYLSTHSTQAEKFLRAVYNGYQYIKTQSHQKSAEALSLSFSGMTTEELAIAVEQYVTIDAWCSSPVMTSESLNRLLDVLNSTQSTTYSGNYSELVNTEIASKIV